IVARRGGERAGGRRNQGGARQRGREGHARPRGGVGQSAKAAPRRAASVVAPDPKRLQATHFCFSYPGQFPLEFSGPHFE
ncbi:MAG TPA: hypothetical protein VGU27_11635, partial [Candidatus Eisenbacteria bacterium]|nr:hypothetical protein [Candidatus Eisenbacteria bacterium]